MTAENLDRPLLKLIGVLLLGGTMGLLDGSMVAVAMDTFAGRFETSLSMVGWIATGYLLAITTAIPVTAWATDRLGGRRLWLIALTVFLIGSLASGLAWDIASMIVFRVVQGFGAGMLEPTMLTLLARAAGPLRAGRVMGIMGIVMSTGPVVGPVIGGVIIELADWRWMFLVNIPIGVAAVYLARRVLPADDSAQTPVSRLDVTGLSLLTPGFTALVFALSQVAEQGRFNAPTVVIPLIAAAALMAGYVTRALRPGAVPLVDVRLFARPAFTAAVTVMALVGTVNFASLFVLPLYYQQNYGHGVLAAGVLIAPYGIGGAISMFVAGRLSDRLGARRLALAGSILTAATLSVVALLGTETGQVVPVVASLLLGGALGFVGAPTMGSLYRTLPADKTAQGSSMLFMFNQVGASIGVAGVALLVQSSGFAVAFGAAGFAALIIAAMASLLPGRPVEAEEPVIEPAHT